MSILANSLGVAAAVLSLMAISASVVAWVKPRVPSRAGLIRFAFFTSIYAAAAFAAILILVPGFRVEAFAGVALHVLLLAILATGMRSGQSRR